MGNLREGIVCSFHSKNKLSLISYKREVQIEKIDFQLRKKQKKINADRRNQVSKLFQLTSISRLMRGIIRVRSRARFRGAVRVLMEMDRSRSIERSVLWCLFERRRWKGRGRENLERGRNEVM